MRLKISSSPIFFVSCPRLSQGGAFSDPSLVLVLPQHCLIKCICSHRKGQRLVYRFLRSSSNCVSDSFAIRSAQPSRALSWQHQRHAITAILCFDLMPVLSRNGFGLQGSKSLLFFLEVGFVNVVVGRVVAVKFRFD